MPDDYEVRFDPGTDATAADRERAAAIFGAERVAQPTRVGPELSTGVEVTLAAVLMGAAGSAVWDFVRWAAPRVRAYLDGRLERSVDAVAVYRARAAGMIWEIRHRPEQALGEYEAGVVIGGVDTWELPADAARISIDLVHRRVSVFDGTGRHVGDLEWPGGAG